VYAPGGVEDKTRPLKRSTPVEKGYVNTGTLGSDSRHLLSLQFILQVWILGANTPSPGIHCSTTYDVTGEMNEADVTVNRGPRQPAEDAFNISIGH
jgi:hypothetical protein